MKQIDIKLKAKIKTKVKQVDDFLFWHGFNPTPKNPINVEVYY